MKSGPSTHHNLRLACAAVLGALVVSGCAGNNTGLMDGRDVVALNQSAIDHGSGTLTQGEIRSYRGVRASELMNRPVVSSKGEPLGQISDLVVHMSTGDVRYAVLNASGGADPDLYAVPTKLLRMKDDGTLSMNLDRARAEANKRWKANQWPSVKDSAYWSEVDRMAGMTPVQPGKSYYAYRLSELIGKDIDNIEGRHLGKISDVVVDMNRQKVHYAVLQFEPNVNVTSNELFAVPIHSIIFRDGNPQRAVLNIQQDRLARLAGFNAKNWPALNDPHYLRGLERTWIVIVPADRAVGATR